MPKLSGPYDQVAWQGQTFLMQVDGSMDVPDEAVAELLSLGMSRWSPVARPAVLEAEPTPEPQAAPSEAPRGKGKGRR